MSEIDFTKLRFNCSNIHKFIKQNQKKVFTNQNVEDLAALKLKMMSKNLNKSEHKKYQGLIKKLEFDETDLFLAAGTNYLKFLYLVKKYGQSFALKGGVGIAQLVRGIKSEPASIKLISEYFGRDFFRHKKRIYNDKIVGSLDVTDADTIEKSTKIVDIKTTFSHLNFTHLVGMEIPEQYFYQMQGYFYLTGMEYGEVCYCLTDYPEYMIEQQREIIHSQLCPECPPEEVNDAFISEWTKAYNSLTFNHVPIQERVIVFPVHRDENIISEISEKVDICREYLIDFDKQHTKFFDEQYQHKDNFRHYSADKSLSHTRG